MVSPYGELKDPRTNFLLDDSKIKNYDKQATMNPTSVKEARNQVYLDIRKVLFFSWSCF